MYKNNPYWIIAEKYSKKTIRTTDDVAEFYEKASENLSDEEVEKLMIDFEKEQEKFTQKLNSLCKTKT